MTARIIAARRKAGLESLDENTALNVRKVTRYRENGVEALEKAIEELQLSGAEKEMNGEKSDQVKLADGKEEGKQKACGR